MTQSIYPLNRAADTLEADEITAPFEDHFVTVDGVRVRYLREGNGPTLLLIHGFGVNAETWRRNIPVLATKWRILAPDLIGHGKSERPEEVPYSMQYYVESLQSFLKLLKVQCYSAVAHSMGGLLAIRLALSESGDKMKALVLEDSAGLGGGPSFRIRMSFLSYLIRMNILGPSEKRVRGWLQKGFYSDPSKISEEAVNRALESWKDPNYRRMQRKIAMGFRKEEHHANWTIHEIVQPTMIVWGAQDRQISARMALRAAERMQNCKIEVIQNCGHTPHSECSEEFNTKVLAFLNGLTQSTSLH